MDSLELEQHSQQRSSIAFRSTEKLQAARGGAWGWRWTPAFWVLHIGGWRRDPWHWFREPSSMRNLWRFVGWRPSRVARNDNGPGSNRVFAYSNPTHGPGLATRTGPIINRIFFFGAQTSPVGPQPKIIHPEIITIPKSQITEYTCNFLGNHNIFLAIFLTNQS